MTAEEADARRAGMLLKHACGSLLRLAAARFCRELLQEPRCPRPEFREPLAISHKLCRLIRIRSEPLFPFLAGEARGTQGCRRHGGRGHLASLMLAVHPGKHHEAESSSR